MGINEDPVPYMRPQMKNNAQVHDVTVLMKGPETENKYTKEFTP